MSRTLPPENPVPTTEPEPVYADTKEGHVLDDEILVVTPLSDDEPLVTRKELWSYYSACLPLVELCSRALVDVILWSVYYNGDNVSTLQPLKPQTSN